MHGQLPTMDQVEGAAESSNPVGGEILREPKWHHCTEAS